MVTTDRADLAETLRRFSGIMESQATPASAMPPASGNYEMVLLGFNYRLTDIACALGLSQLKKTGGESGPPREIAARLRSSVSEHRGRACPHCLATRCKPAWHLYPIV